MLRAIKYELNPTNNQKKLIRQTCGCCRKVYNTMLAPESFVVGVVSERHADNIIWWVHMT